MTESLGSLVDYLVDNGMDEGEINHFLHQKIFKRQSIMEFVQQGDWQRAWKAAIAYVTGGDY